MHFRLTVAAKLLSAAVFVTTGCAKNRTPQPDRGQVWHLPSPLFSNEIAARVAPGEQRPSLGSLIAIDSAFLRPVIVRRGGSGYVEVEIADSARGADNRTFAVMHLVRPSVVTTYQGNRYRPEIIRALANDTVVLGATARIIASTSDPSGIILDFQDSPPGDIPLLVAMTRAIRDAARPRGRSPIALVVPAADTVSYPTEVLGRVADILLIRLHGEHRPGTPPGPLTTPDFLARSVGMRARVTGASRLGAELPLYGYRWDRDGTSTPITYVDAQALVISEARVFTRDPVSQFLTATGRDGWTIWIPDARTIQFMSDIVRRRGINVIALSGVEGADPSIFATSPPIRR